MTDSAKKEDSLKKDDTTSAAAAQAKDQAGSDQDKRSNDGSANGEIEEDNEVDL